MDTVSNNKRRGGASSCRHNVEIVVWKISVKGESIRRVSGSGIQEEKRQRLKKKERDRFIRSRIRLLMCMSSVFRTASSL